jgi:hypothetical protein
LGGVLKVLGIVVLVWLGFILLGAVFKFLFWAVLIGGLVFLGVLAYGAIKGRSEPPAIR